MNKYSFIGELPIFTKNGIPVADSFVRIVHGGRGAYVEFDSLYKQHLHIPEKEKWRVNSTRAYYIEYRTYDGVKVYYQKKPVDYADYKIGRWYISPMYLEGFEAVGEYDYTKSK